MSSTTSAAEGWRKSSYSSINGNCLEVWVKSSYSYHEANCLEWRKSEVVAGPGCVAVRDSKDPSGPVLQFTSAQWKAFTAGIK